MAINIFEGARRIALLLGCGAAIITVLVAFDQSPRYSASYSLATPNAPFIKTESICPDAGKSLHFYHKVSDEKIIYVSVCLEPMLFKNKSDEEIEHIPYRIDSDGMTWGASPYSMEVQNYEKQVERRFTMPPADVDISITEAKKQWRINFAQTIGYLIAGLGLFSGFVWAIGWIVRGFLGIPRGLDARPG